MAGRQGRQQGASARMPTRITVRYLGSEVGKKVARPDTKGELLELAAKRLNQLIYAGLAHLCGGR